MPTGPETVVNLTGIAFVVATTGFSVYDRFGLIFS